MTSMICQHAGSDTKLNGVTFQRYSTPYRSSNPGIFPVYIVGITDYTEYQTGQENTQGAVFGWWISQDWVVNVLNKDQNSDCSAAKRLYVHICAVLHSRDKRLATSKDFTGRSVFFFSRNK